MAYVRRNPADFVTNVKTGERSLRYVFQLENRVRRVIAGIDAQSLHDLDPLKVSRFLANLRTKKRGVADVTCNGHATSTKAFTKWAAGGK